MFKTKFKFGKMCKNSRKWQLTAKSVGSEQANTYCLCLSSVTVGVKYPSEDAINSFLVGHLSVEVTKVCSVLHNRAQKSVQISFMDEDDVIKFEGNLSKRVNIQFPGAGPVKISGYRLDKKYITARLVGAPRWVEKSDIDILFSLWGRVLASEGGSST